MPEVALYGGSFDPPHTGHVLGIAWVLSAAGVDGVMVIPTWRHAFGKPLSPFEHRVAMCRLAARPFAEGLVAVSTVEEDIGGTSRTIDTLKHLIARHPDHRFKLVVGSDVLAESHAWKAFDELRSLCEFLVLGRTGHAAPEGYLCSPPLADVSSTRVRDRVRQGLSVTGLVPRAVADYVAEHRLYR